MSERALLERFDLVAENPENIPLLRRYIVDLAVRGKLLEKTALDISAAEILKRIDGKADLLIKQGQLKKQKPLDPIDVEEIPAAYAAHCTFERLGNVANLQKGQTGIQSAIPGEFPLVVTAAARSTCDHYDFDGAAAIVPMVSSTGHGHASLNRLHYQEGKFALGTILCAVFPIDEELITARFLFEYLTAFKDELLVSKMNGTANVTLTVGRIAEVPVPIIAPAVQRRVDELMALCDQLEAAKNEREARRDRLVAASLHSIGAASAVESDGHDGAQSATPLRDAARFHLDHLPRLTARPEHIEQLRQTILNLAVRGRLIPQDPNDEPAAELLKRIQAEKARGKKLMQANPQMEGIEQLADLPLHWTTAPLIALGSWALGAGFPKNEQGLTEGPHFFLKVSDMNLPGNEKYVTVSNNCIDDAAAMRIRAKIHPPGTIIFPKIGGAIATNKRRILTRGSAIDNNCLGIAFSKEIDIEWAYLLLTTLDFTQYQAGTAVPALQQGVLEVIPVGLPPLAEQHRIVTKVDELMALCDQLETQLTATQTDSRRLLEAVLHEALAAA